MLQKLLHSDPNERPSAKSLLNLQWLVGEEGLHTPTELDSPNKVKSKVGTQMTSRDSQPQDFSSLGESMR